MRIALIHALRHSCAPIAAAFAAAWPAPRLMSLPDDSLSADLARDGRLTEAMTERFLTLARYAVGTDAAAILFTCSAFGPCIDRVKQEFPGIPVLKPNEAMIEEAAALGHRIGLLATFPATPRTMPAEFPGGVEVCARLAEGALAAGDGAGHDRIAAEAAAALADCDAIALAQFSLTRAREAVAARAGRPVLTTPDSAVRKLRALLA